MAAFRREAAKQQWTVRLVVMTALAAFAAVAKVDAQSAPGDFELWGVPTSATSLEVVVFVPEQKNGSLDKCFGTLSGPDTERNFTCDDHGGKSSTQTFKHLQPETEYNCTVTFANLLPDGQVAGTTKSISLKTQADPPEVTNLTLVSAENGTFTVAWQKPEGIVDQYWVQVSARAASGDDDGDGERRAGLCSNGTILSREVTHLTCGGVEPCTNVTVTVRVLNFPRRSSTTSASDGVRLPIFFSGNTPDPPSNVTISAESPTETRVLWEPVPAPSSGVILYDVRLVRRTWTVRSR
ncbi:hypothetical protein HPB50_005649 [Hyalomma asiaticum]|uniref:Uncharacterized protein n=1 Tax=Hyalomma asiaticum TaxID=266040 RepID=A0ACB7RPB2_HYAAI|nr:hypothetical protein HPB50_005649 [Hyalomma asiaticum]